MSIAFNCQECGSFNEHDDRFAGCVVVCPACDRNVIVPNPEFAGVCRTEHRRRHASNPFNLPIGVIAFCFSIVPFAGAFLAAIFQPGHPAQWLGPSLIVIGTPVSLILSSLAIYHDRTDRIARAAIALTGVFVVLILALVLISVGI